MNSFAPVGLYKTQIVNVPATQTVVALPQNRNRKFLFLQNNEATDVDLFFVNADGSEIALKLKGNSTEFVPELVPVNELKIGNPEATDVDIVMITVGD